MPKEILRKEAQNPDTADRLSPQQSTPIRVNLPRYLVAALAIVGMSVRQSTHQVAKKLRTTGLLARSSSGQLRLADGSRDTSRRRAGIRL
jgi:hypothetical protein